jgi:hypothetical protein
LIREAKWKVKEQSNYEQWATAGDLDDDAGGWNISIDDPHRKQWVESDHKVMVSYMAINQGWPSVEGGVMVLIEVQSDLKDSEEDRPPVGRL